MTSKQGRLHYDVVGCCGPESPGPLFGPSPHLNGAPLSKKRNQFYYPECEVLHKF